MARMPAAHHEHHPRTGAPVAPLTALAPAKVATHGRCHYLAGAVATTATRLPPLVALLDAVRPAAVQESVFRARRKKIWEYLALVCKELQAERPRYHTLAHAFQTLVYLVREKTRGISPDELK